MKAWVHGMRISLNRAYHSSEEETRIVLLRCLLLFDPFTPLPFNFGVFLRWFPQTQTPRQTQTETQTETTQTKLTDRDYTERNWYYAKEDSSSKATVTAADSMTQGAFQRISNPDKNFEPKACWVSLRRLAPYEKKTWLQRRLVR